MVVKTFAGFKRLVIVVFTLLGFLITANWDVPADASNPYRATVAQNETQTATNEKNASSPASKEPESKGDEKEESTSAKEKPLKDFKPSERIEAEQAVDFPYDI
jgi:hypothetical protein